MQGRRSNNFSGQQDAKIKTLAQKMSYVRQAKKGLAEEKPHLIRHQREKLEEIDTENIVCETHMLVEEQPVRRRRRAETSKVLPEEQQRAKRQRRVREARLDPFGIPPSACDATIFRIQQPFIQVIFSANRIRMTEDVVSDGKSMNAEALKAAIGAISQEYVLASHTSHTPTSELSFRDLHIPLMKSFWWLTRPRSQKVLRPADVWALREPITRGEHSEPEDLRGLDVEIDTCNAFASEPGLSNNSLDVRLEGDAGELDEKQVKATRYDMKCQVYDERFESPIVVLLVECKWGALTVESIFQVAAYACDEIKTNMQKGIFKPLQLEVWNESSWRYAVLYPTGCVVLQDQKIVEANGSRSKQARVTDFERKKMNGKHPGLLYPDGEYLEGILYISNEKYTLPGLSSRGSLMTHDSQLFFQSKLRILVGEKVLSWTVDDVKSALKVREDILSKNHAMLMGD